jgi:hypothetical protein
MVIIRQKLEIDHIGGHVVLGVYRNFNTNNKDRPKQT